MLASFEDWWASGRFTPQPGPSSALQPPLVTPPVVLALVPSSALAIPAAAAPSMPSQSVASSFRSAEWHRPRILSSSCSSGCPGSISWELPDTSPIRKPSAVTGPITQPFLVLFPEPSLVRRPSTHETGQPAGPIPGPIICLKAVTTHGTHHSAVASPVHRPVIRPEAVPVPGTRRLGVPEPVNHPGAVHYNGNRLPPSPSPGPGPVAREML